MAAGVLAATTAYLFVGYGTMRSVRAEARAALVAEGFEPEAMRVLPSFLNNQAFRVLARRGDEFRVGYWSNVAGEGTEWLELQSAGGDAARAVLDTPHGRIFEWFSDGMVWIRPRDEGEGYLLVDLRFGGITQPLIPIFAATATPADDGWRVDRAERPSPDFEGEPAALWSVIWTGDAAAWRGNDVQGTPEERP